MPPSIVDRLARHVERFDCSITTKDRKLMIFTDPPTSIINRRGEHVGTVYDGPYADWGIESLKDYAPDYLKPLVGKSFNSAALLKGAVRRAAFVNELRQVLGELLDEIEASSRS